ncbi:uncharacterized protein N7515_010287 [Penicillium bovifimosum]|uniref:Uncharacterized protein n=1 Tax=Penicillium bovifimosum TaxID=126998 RepID=A0A9W9GJA6_9EURO|nr:uncharacterized protein N7515_010287 [Penicillium bovifimosum]KAJ5120899.1 hypothetical protein N7515_010287 [Penicillium bovifimosum]
MLSLSPLTVSSSSLGTNDAESSKKSVGNPESLSSVEAATDCDSHLPFEIPGAVVLSAPSLPVLQEAANELYRQINSDPSCTNQYIIVLNISQPLQEVIGGDRNPLEVPYRLTLDEKHQRGVIRIIPSKAHERVTQSFSAQLIRNNPSDDDDWPSLVIETGLSESEAQLRNDAHWWFSNSGYQVKLVLLIHIQRSPQRRVVLKLYSLRPTTARITRGLQVEVGRTLLDDPASSQAVPPTQLRPHLAAREIVVTSSNVENAPLELEFESVMRRPPAPNTKERNIIFTAEDLTSCCRHPMSFR